MQLHGQGNSALVHFVCHHVKISHCNLLCDRLTEVKYNEISQLGILNGDCIYMYLIEVAA